MDAAGPVNPAGLRLCRLGEPPYTRAMCPRIRPRVAAAILAAAAGLCGALPGIATAQQRDGQIPDPGDLWLEFSPRLLNWTDQFALDSRDSTIADGGREPLFADFDGSIASRLYPGPQVFVDDVNEDAAALGFTPFAEESLSFGDFRYSDINAQLRRLAAGFELGVYHRIAVGVRAPLTLSQVEPSFVFDSTTATVTYARNALSASDPFFDEAAAALAGLDDLIADGTLAGQELADAMALRSDTDAFLAALEGRVSADRLIPTAMSPAGTEMLSRFGEFVGAFTALGLTLPALALPETARSADVNRLFGVEWIDAALPHGTGSSLVPSDFELTVRVSLLDGITPRYVSPTSQPAISPEPAAPDSAAAEEPASEVPERRPRGTIRLRTTVGALVRIPAGTNGAVPFVDPRLFHQVPIGDGQMDIELQLYQDIAIGDWFLLRGVGRYGIQMADDLILRVHPPDRPFAFATTTAQVRRDLGDYMEMTLRPAIRLNSAMWVGIDYDYWRLGDARFTILEGLEGGPTDASPLELETGQTRHMLGLGITYDLQNARGRDDVVLDRRPIRSPWLFSLSIRRSISGSGGRTPAPFMYMATMRIPIGIF